MKLEQRTILITGGTSGIGLEAARQLSERGNVVIVTGRDQGRLDRARRAVSGLHAIRSDAADPSAILSLRDEMTERFPALDVLINNAGIMRKIDLTQDRSLDDLTQEIEIGLSAPLRVTQLSFRT